MEGPEDEDEEDELDDEDMADDTDEAIRDELEDMLDVLFMVGSGGGAILLAGGVCRKRQLRPRTSSLV